MSQKKLISWVMPCFDEEQVINKTLDRIIKVSLSMSDYSWELIIVDDGSKDQTSDLIKKFNRRKIDIHLIRFSRIGKKIE